MISCIIPFFNEEKSIIKTLDVICSAKGILEIICVDDGSTDDSSKKIEELFPSIKVVKHNKNRGKAEAICTGTTQTNGDAIFILDADLKNLNKEEIEKATRFMNSEKFDMIIFRRVLSPMFIKINRADLIFTGTRMLLKSDLEKILETKPKGYQLEVAINKYMRENKKIVGWIPSKTGNTYKHDKWGGKVGLTREISMFGEILRYTGFFEYIRQIFWFAPKEIL